MHSKGVRYPPSPVQGPQPMPSHCPPDAKCQLQWHFSRGHSERPNAVGFGTFCGVSELLVWCAKLSFRGRGGVCVYFLKSVRKCRFSNVWVWERGVGGHISEHRADTWTMHGTEHCARDHRLFRI